MNISDRLKQTTDLKIKSVVSFKQSAQNFPSFFLLIKHAYEA
jgi:hypothetical protein